ncbi:MAG TPA: hypothetical protein VEV37_09675 [Bryobacteraceae bacterium]|nr:hypothetical protein [Bryobacteraceae bacterium]
MRTVSLGRVLTNPPKFQKQNAMSTIQSNRGIVTQINFLDCEPSNQQPLVDLLIESARSVCHLPGWLSANIHPSFDGKRVVNYARSENHEAAQRVIEELKAEGLLDRNKMLGEAHPGLYEVVLALQR